MNELTNDFTSNEMQLNSLIEQYGSIVPDSTTHGVETSKVISDRMRTARLAVEARRKELKEPYLLKGRQIDAKAKNLISKIKAIEEPHKAAVDEHRGSKKHTKKPADASVKLTQSDLTTIIRALKYATHHSDDYTAAVTDAIVDKMVMALNKIVETKNG